MWFKYGLKAQKLQKQHALKGQKLLAQGIALSIIAVSKAPCKGKSLKKSVKSLPIPLVFPPPAPPPFPAILPAIHIF